MARVQSNLVIHGLSGMLGKQVVIRQQRNGQYILAAAPNRREHELTDAQKQHRERFRQAILYAKKAQTTPEYQDLAKARGQTAYNVAVADFMHPPEIVHIDLTAYQGAAGQPIVITTVDDVKVKTVGVLIATDEGSVVEKGSAEPSATEANQWRYMTTATAPSASVKIVVDVADLAGQIAEETEHT
ncbi:MAG TPA: hypothetical protein VIV60_07555 [Polyangiaceae bacterium]